jgi:hypothetical protein
MKGKLRVVARIIYDIMGMKLEIVVNLREKIVKANGFMCRWDACCNGCFIWHFILHPRSTTSSTEGLDSMCNNCW